MAWGRLEFKLPTVSLLLEDAESQILNYQTARIKLLHMLSAGEYSMRANEVSIPKFSPT